MGAALGVGDHECRRGGASPGPARALDVVGCFGWHVAEHHRLQLADVDAELERGRTRQYVHLSGHETALHGGGFHRLPLGGVLLSAQRNLGQRPIQHPVVIGVRPGVRHCVRDEPARARAVRAHSADVVNREPSADGAPIPVGGPAGTKPQPLVRELIDDACTLVVFSLEVPRFLQEVPARVEDFVRGSLRADRGERLSDQQKAIVGGARLAAGPPADDAFATVGVGRPKPDPSVARLEQRVGDVDVGQQCQRALQTYRFHELRQQSPQLVFGEPQPDQAGRQRRLPGAQQ
ncbi:Uncharacterised protein [Mycobacteroides abscessus subsp. abscessus]|nr:Uncharacterised protein [Mycobacteroides abscessus subsp. abscessus]